MPVQFQTPATPGENNIVTPLRAVPVAIRWHTDLPIYASEPYLRALGYEYGWLGGVDPSGVVQCVLPYVLVRKMGFRFVSFKVETIPLHGDLTFEEESRLLDSAVEYWRSTGVDLVIPNNNTALFRTFPKGATAAPYGTFIIDLQQSETALEHAMDSAYRNKVRAGIKGSVQIRTGIEHLETCYRLIVDTLQRSDHPFKSQGEFERMVRALGDNVALFVAEAAGEPQACLVSPFSTYGAYSLYVGTRTKPVKGSMHLLQWQALLHFRSRGVKRFNFQGVRLNPEKGSKQEGIFTFKKGFGGELVSGYVWKYSIRPVQSAMYNVAVRLLRGGDIVDVERRRLKELEGILQHGNEEQRPSAH